MQLYKSYVSKDNLGPAGSGGGETRETQQGYNRQREHLERNVEQLKNKITKVGAPSGPASRAMDLLKSKRSYLVMILSVS